MTAGAPAGNPVHGMAGIGRCPYCSRLTAPLGKCRRCAKALYRTVCAFENAVEDDCHGAAALVAMRVLEAWRANDARLRTLGLAALANASRAFNHGSAERVALEAMYVGAVEETGEGEQTSRQESKILSAFCRYVDATALSPTGWLLVPPMMRLIRDLQLHFVIDAAAGDQEGVSRTAIELSSVRYGRDAEGLRYRVCTVDPSSPFPIPGATRQRSLSP